MITKETYAWVEELLDPKITEISDDDYNKLVRDYFREDKTDWLSEEKILECIANIKEFWDLIRKFSLPRGKKMKLYNFKKFVFPNFYEMKTSEKNNFWVDSINKSFSYKVDFDGASFIDSSLFEKITFEEVVIFSNTKLKKDLIIRNCQFKKDVFFVKSELNDLKILNSSFLKQISFINSECEGTLTIGQTNFEGFLPSFYDSKFHQKVIFSKTTFSGSACRFNESIFLDDVEFFECKFAPKYKIEFQAVTFSKKVDFIRCEFLNDVTFNQSQFKDIAVFDLPIFKEKADFSYCYFEDVNFKEINTYWSYRDYNYIEPAKLYFKDVFFNSKTFIKNTDLSNLELDNSDITNITFSRCIWNDKENRLKLVDELPKRNIETKNQLKLSNENSSKKTVIENLIKKLRDSENHYRQLKKNFDNTKNWELSGKAYISEMEMRKRRLYHEEKYYQWSIYKFYDVFGGYTQDFRKPIVSLIGLIFTFSILYFFIDYDFVKALQRGIKGALPYLEIDTENPFEGYWLVLRNIELILGGTFLAFFILALRKRFKQ